MIEPKTVNHRISIGINDKGHRRKYKTDEVNEANRMYMEPHR